MAAFHLLGSFWMISL